MFTRNMSYTNIFFDLDHTLWDFERNSSESLSEVFREAQLEQYGIPSEIDFVQSFLKINTKLWDQFDRGLIPHTFIRENRFKLVFQELGASLPAHQNEIGEIYLQTLPTKKHLLEGAISILDYLSNKGYRLHIITNGFNDVQNKKIQSSGIAHYFSNVVTFETANAKKPDPLIYEYAIGMTNTHRSECLMIGDNWIADIWGAKQVGLDTIYYNPSRLKFDDKPTFDIQHLLDLKHIL
jgi:YjjG family noncanonical pyrimidine nucleotidase